MMQSLNIGQQRLFHQRIADPSCSDAAEVVQWLGAVQSQDFASAKWALGLRMRAASDRSVEQAFDAGAILRTHLLRPTWHFVTPADIHWMLKLTAPRVHAVNAPHYRKWELEPATLQRGTEALARALQDGTFLTRDEAQAVFEQAGIVPIANNRLAYLLMFAELEGVICSGPRRGKQFTYALLDERAPQPRQLAPDEAAAELAWRFFASRGPATVHDFAKWSGLTVATCRAALESIKSRLQHLHAHGQAYWRSTVVPSVPEPSAYLLSVFDEFISGYKDRSTIVDAGYGAELQGLGNDLTAIVVVQGQIVGTWKRSIKKDAVLVNIRLSRALTPPEEQALHAAISAYGRFLELPALHETLIRPTSTQAIP